METMKTAEELLKEKGITPETVHHNYAYVYRVACDLIGEAIKIGKANGHEEAMQWIDPNIELPDYYKKVIVKYQREDSKIDYACVSRLADDDGTYFFGDYHFDIFIDFNRVIGWKPIE